MSPRLVNPIIALLVLSGGVLAGCGGSEEADRPDDRADIETLVAGLNRAIESDDPVAWCRVFSPSSIERTFGSEARCRRETAKVLENGRSPERVAIAEIVFVDDTARVSFEGRAGDANLVLEDGEWFFSLDQQVDPAAGDGQTDGGEVGS